MEKKNLKRIYIMHFTYILSNFKINMTSISNNKYIKYLCKSINENENLKIQIQSSIMKKKIENNWNKYNHENLQ